MGLAAVTWLSSVARGKGRGCTLGLARFSLGAGMWVFPVQQAGHGPCAPVSECESPAFHEDSKHKSHSHYQDIPYTYCSERLGVRDSLVPYQ